MKLNISYPEPDKCTGNNQSINTTVNLRDKICKIIFS